MISTKKEPKKPIGLSDKNIGDLGNNSFSGMVWTKGEEIETWSLDSFFFFLSFFLSFFSFLFCKGKGKEIGKCSGRKCGLKMTFLIMKIKI